MRNHRGVGWLELLVILALAGSLAAAEPSQPPERVALWLKEPQSWTRDRPEPIVSLGKQGAFDDTHIFAPGVGYDRGRYLLYYCGSRGVVAERVFAMGLAKSRDGRNFQRHSQRPVFEFGDGKHSVLTPTLLRKPDGSTLREDGRLRLWFSSTWFAGPSGLHTLHSTTSPDGLAWSKPSPPLMKNVYAPTILKTDDGYRMWYTDVGKDPWVIGHAHSKDGQTWRASPRPCLEVDQEWERQRLFYPAVLRVEGVYLMWYGSYWAARRQTTAIGFAVSADGLKWYKSPANPVLRPDPKRAWESHYVTSQSVMQTGKGRFRIWYASRRKPPFRNKYFALNTAVWRR